MPVTLNKSALKQIAVDARREQRSKQKNSAFLTRTRGIYTGQQNRLQKEPGGGVELPYTLADLRGLCAASLEEPCAYCGGKLTVKNMCADHAESLASGGTWEISNLRIVDQSCNFQKGKWTEREFREMLAAARDILSEPSFVDFKRRLTIGGKWSPR